MKGVIIQALELALKMNDPVTVFDFGGARVLDAANYDPRQHEVVLVFENGEETRVSPLLHLNIERLR